MDADNSFYVKFIATYAPTFLGFIISVLAMVNVNRILTRKTACESNLPFQCHKYEKNYLHVVVEVLDCMECYVEAP